jgi:DNA-binding transcriptional MerR regulator
MDVLTIQQAAETTGWSPRMLRYLERVGLVTAARSPSGYRLYGAEQLQRLRTLRELLNRFEVGLADVSFAARMRRDEQLRRALDEWFETSAQRPEQVPADDWLRWEQNKHRRLLEHIEPSHQYPGRGSAEAPPRGSWPAEPARRAFRGTGTREASRNAKLKEIA